MAVQLPLRAQRLEPAVEGDEVVIGGAELGVPAGPGPLIGRRGVVPRRPSAVSDHPVMIPS